MMERAAASANENNENDDSKTEWIKNSIEIDNFSLLSPFKCPNLHCLAEALRLLVIIVANTNIIRNGQIKCIIRNTRHSNLKLKFNLETNEARVKSRVDIQHSIRISFQGK